MLLQLLSYLPYESLSLALDQNCPKQVIIGTTAYISVFG